MKLVEEAGGGGTYFFILNLPFYFLLSAYFFKIDFQNPYLVNPDRDPIIS